MRLWNIQANAHRMLEGCERMMIPAVPPGMFIRACEWCVAANRAYIPPYGTGRALYLRPYILGMGRSWGCRQPPIPLLCPSDAGVVVLRGRPPAD